MEKDGFGVVAVVLEDREDGGLFVYSDDLPGLILAGLDPAEVCKCIAPAIEALFRHAGREVIVHPETPFIDAMRAKSPRKVDMHVQRFIVEYRQAA